MRPPLSELLVIKTKNWELLHHCFEFCAGAEFWSVSGRDFDRFASLWVATDAGFAFCFGECTEANEFNVVAFFHGFFDVFHSAIQDCFGLGFGDFSFGGDFLDQLSFVHAVSFVVSVLSCSSCYSCRPMTSVSKNIPNQASIGIFIAIIVSDFISRDLRV